MLLWAHNPDYYATAEVSRYWSTAHANAQVSSSGYDGTNGLTASALGAYAIRYVNPTDHERFAIGGRVKVTALPASAQILLAVVDGSGSIHVGVCLNTDGTLSIFRGSTATILSTSTAVLALNAWHRLGLTGRVHGSLGEAAVHFNSTRYVPNVVTSIASTDTAGAAEAWEGIYVGLGSSIVSGHYYAVDGSGAVSTLLHGTRVRVLFPAATGTFDEWTLTGGDLHEVLDDATPDDATTMIDTAVDLARFSVTMATLADTPTIHGVQQTAQVLNYAGVEPPPTHEPIAVIDGEAHPATGQSVGSATWASVWAMRPVHPVSGERWTVAAVNAAEWGGQVRA